MLSEMIRTDMPDEAVDPELFSKVHKQIHRHSFTCQREPRLPPLNEAKTEEEIKKMSEAEKDLYEQDRHCRFRYRREGVESTWIDWSGMSRGDDITQVATDASSDSSRSSLDDSLIRDLSVDSVQASGASSMVLGSESSPPPLSRSPASPMSTGPSSPTAANQPPQPSQSQQSSPMSVGPPPPAEAEAEEPPSSCLPTQETQMSGSERSDEAEASVSEQDERMRRFEAAQTNKVSIHLKRRPEDGYVNNWNEAVCRGWDANHDIQVCRKFSGSIRCYEWSSFQPVGNVRGAITYTAANW